MQIQEHKKLRAHGKQPLALNREKTLVIHRRLQEIFGYVDIFATFKNPFFPKSKKGLNVCQTDEVLVNMKSIYV